MSNRRRAVRPELGPLGDRVRLATMPGVVDDDPEAVAEMRRLTHDSLVKQCQTNPHIVNHAGVQWSIARGRQACERTLAQCIAYTGETEHDAEVDRLHAMVASLDDRAVVVVAMCQVLVDEAAG